MYGLAYVLLPTEFTSLQKERDRTLAAFMRGGEEDFPREKLAFKDVTTELTKLHRAKVRYGPGATLTWLSPGDAAYELCLLRLTEHMSACSVDQFEGTLAEIEPDFAAFVRRFTELEGPDPTIGRYGRWLNPIGHWD